MTCDVVEKRARASASSSSRVRVLTERLRLRRSMNIEDLDNPFVCNHRLMHAIVSTELVLS